MTNISPVSSSLLSPSGGGSNTEQLQRQKATLEKELAAEKASDDEDSVKALKVAQLEMQIKAIEAAIKAQESKETKSPTNPEKGKGGVVV